MVNRFLRVLATSGLVVAGLAFQQSSAHAAFVTAIASTGGSAFAGENYSTFDNRVLGNSTQTTASGLTTAFTGGGAFVQGNSPGFFAPPIFSGANNQFFYPNATSPTPPPSGLDTTTYVSTGIGSATMTFNVTSPVTYFGLLWGSVDSYNSLTFNFVDGTSQTVTGSMLSGVTANAGMSTYVNFLASAGITSVVARSTQTSFEFDNVAFGAVPEPSSLALCGIAGVLGLGVARKRAKRVVA